MKRIVIGILAYVVFLACVIGLAIALAFTGTKLILFCVLLGVLGAAATVFIVWFMPGKDPAIAGAGSADDLNLTAILKDADRKLKANPGGIKSLASAPILYVIGEDNSAKTETVLRSGLDAELLAGNLYRDSKTAPTELVNVWLAGQNVLIEAGGPVLRQPGLWQRLIRATIPGQIKSVVHKNPVQPTRAAVLCVSLERLVGPREPGYNADQIRATAQTLNERLRELSQTLGIALPVYVLFTKLDTLPHFGEYATRLGPEEVKIPLGAMLEHLETGSGLYAERASAMISARFDELNFALASFRLNVLSRSGDPKGLANAYEFPRDLNKRRDSIVNFLVELTRPSQLGLNPFLRGFYFSGLRAVIDDNAAPAPLQAATMAADDGATRMFTVGGAAQSQPQPMRAPVRSGSRRVPQWVFLPHLFTRVLLNDKSALEASRISTNANGLKRALLIVASCLLLAYLVLLTVSFVKNHDLEQQVATAAALPISAQSPSQSPGQLAGMTDLQNLDRIGVLLMRLDKYHTEGAPWSYRWGLYSGESLYPVACNAFAGKFRTLLLSPAQQNILTQIRGLQSPPPPEADYNSAFQPLKAYLMTTGNPYPDPNRNIDHFLAPALLTAWSGTANVPADQARLVQAQFETYATILPEPGSCLLPLGGAQDAGSVARSRAYLNGFSGFEHVYQSMIAAAGRSVPAIRYNEYFPGSSRYIIDNYTVAGAFTRTGFTFMQDAIQHPDPYFSGEAWVLGSTSNAGIDRTALPGQLQKQYTGDFLAAWRAYMAAAHFTGYSDMRDAASKLGQLDSQNSPILQLFWLISTNTAVPMPELAAAFHAPQAVVPPTSPSGKLLAATNQPYIQALQSLKAAVENYASNPAAATDPNAAQPILQAAGMADQAAENIRNTFESDATAHLDAISFARLEDPITSARAAAGKIPADGGAAKGFCALAAPVLGKFPFSPQSSQEASPEDVATLFSPGQGALSQMTAKLASMITLMGGQYILAQGANLNPAFLNFINAAQKVSSSLFPAGGTQPSLSFTLSEPKSEGASEGTLNIDNQVVAPGATGVPIQWHAQSTSRSVITYGSRNPSFTGPWSLFHLAFAATHPTPNTWEFPDTFLSTHTVVRFNAEGSAATILDPRFMGRLHCVSSVTR